MRVQDFHYDLPEHLIALHPAEKRTDSRLLFVDRRQGSLSHRHFFELDHLFNSGDVLVLNDTRVLPARLLGNRESGGQVETLLLKQKEDQQWEALLRPGGKIKKGARLSFGKNGSTLEVEVMDDPRLNSPERRVKLLNEGSQSNLEEVGHMPLPPYIRRPDEMKDRERYQTVFAKHGGAVAAPTAGLHFDEQLLRRLKEKGVEICFVTLHVSYGTFQPLKQEDLIKEHLFEEEFEVTEEAAQKINTALKENRRIIACGTTSVRTLESAVNKEGNVEAQTSTTQIFIKPPYAFKVVGGLITNFHLPESTLLMLVSAFAGRERVLEAYRTAVEQKYRFYSYGDAMLIL